MLSLLVTLSDRQIATTRTEQPMSGMERVDGRVHLTLFLYKGCVLYCLMDIHC